MSPPQRPLLVYDGDCDFCRRWVARFRRITGGGIEFAAAAEVAGRFPGIPAERFLEAVHLLEPDGRWSRGAEAVFRSLAAGRAFGAPLWLYRRLPGFAAASDACYRLLAAHRHGPRVSACRPASARDPRRPARGAS